MFGLDLSRSEWAALIAVAYLFLRVFGAVAQVVWWHVTDAERVTTPRPTLTLLTAAAVATMCVSALSILTGWGWEGLHIVAFVAAAVVGFVLGMLFDMVILIRSWRVSNWLAARRVPQYRERLLHGDAEVRLGAAKRLASLGAYSRPARPELLAVIRGDPSADVRATAALAVLFSLTEPPDEDAPLAAELRPSLSDADPRVRTCAAAVQLTFHAVPAAELVPLFCDGLKTKDLQTAATAADALGKIGPDAAPAIPDLKAAAMDAEYGNTSAPQALGKIGPAAIPALIEILQIGESSCRGTAADVLGDMGEPARVALPALRAVAGTDDALGHSAKRAIKKLGGEIT